MANFLIFSGGIIALTLSHIYFGAAFSLWSTFYLIFCTKLNRKSKYLSGVLAESKSMLAGVVVDSFSNASNIKLFASKKHELAFISRYIEDVCQRDKDFRKAIFFTVISFLFAQKLSCQL